MSFRSRLRPLKRRAGQLLESAWSLGFGVAGRLRGAAPGRWSSVGGQRVLVVAPHPDDEALGCAGTILLHAAAGDRVCAAIATDGRRSRAIPDPAEMSRQRQREATEAASLMRLDRLAWIGLPEGEWSVPELSHALGALIEEFDPGILYAPSRIDFHPEHLKVAQALALALQARRSSPQQRLRVRVYQAQVPLTSLLTNLVADVSAHDAQCRAALAAYVSQSGSLLCWQRRTRYSARRHAIRQSAEEFWEMTAQRYIKLHCEPSAAWPDAFRGLRPFPLTDPLAYVVGRAERRRLRD